jgi:hypothetical protein
MTAAAALAPDWVEAPRLPLASDALSGAAPGGGGALLGGTGGAGGSGMWGVQQLLLLLLLPWKLGSAELKQETSD